MGSFMHLSKAVAVILIFLRWVLLCICQKLLQLFYFVWKGEWKTKGMKSERVSLGPTKANLSNSKRSACGLLGLGGVLIKI
jgi:hypothetical protein